MTADRTYRPRLRATLVIPTLPSGAKGVSYDLRVRQARLCRNDPNRADELSLTFDWTEAGADPRIISSAQVKFYIWQADDTGEREPTDDDLVFVGIMTKPARKASETERTVTASFLDYTALFLRFKPVPADSVPLMSDTLKTAWSRLIGGFTDQDFRNDMTFLLGALDFRGVASPGPVIGDAITKRFRTKGSHIQVSPQADAWAVWQQAVGMLGLVSYFDRARVVITTTDNFYQGNDLPTLVWGRNILSLSEERDNSFEQKGVGITSFDPDTGRVMESLYPPKDPPAKGKGGKAKASTGNAALGVKSWDYFSMPSISDQVLLDAVAKRAFEERSRQQFKGQVVTSEMSLETASGGAIDILRLSPGDAIRVIVDEADAFGTALPHLYPTHDALAAYYQSRGYAAGVASVLADNAESLTKLRADFYVLTVTTEIDADEDGGKFQTSIEYINRIQATGDASATA